MCSSSFSADKADIVVDDGGWPDGQLLRVRHIELLELDSLRPDLFQEILETAMVRARRTAPLSKSGGREAG